MIEKKLGLADKLGIRNKNRKASLKEKLQAKAEKVEQAEKKVKLKK